MSQESNLFVLLFEKFPELFAIVLSHGKKILKITKKFKEKYEEIKKIVAEYKTKSDRSNIPIINSTEISKYLFLIEKHEDKKYETLRKYMRSEDWAMFLLGQKVINENKNLNAEGATEIKRKAKMIRGRRGIVIINFVVQGYFDEIFLPLLNYQIKNLKSDSEVLNWFNEFLDNNIHFFKVAFWVSASMIHLQIRHELIKRCVSYGVNNVNIHTIGASNVEKIKSILEMLATDPDFPKFDFKIEEDPIVKFMDGRTFKITIKR